MDMSNRISLPLFPLVITPTYSNISNMQDSVSAVHAHPIEDGRTDVNSCLYSSLTLRSRFQSRGSAESYGGP